MAWLAAAYFTGLIPDQSHRLAQFLGGLCVLPSRRQPGQGHLTASGSPWNFPMVGNILDHAGAQARCTGFMNQDTRAG